MEHLQRQFCGGMLTLVYDEVTVAFCRQGDPFGHLLQLLPSVIIGIGYLRCYMSILGWITFHRFFVIAHLHFLHVCTRILYLLISFHTCHVLLILVFTHFTLFLPRDKSVVSGDQTHLCPVVDAVHFGVGDWIMTSSSSASRRLLSIKISRIYSFLHFCSQYV